MQRSQVSVHGGQIGSAGSSRSSARGPARPGGDVVVRRILRVTMGVGCVVLVSLGCGVEQSSGDREMNGDATSGAPTEVPDEARTGPEALLERARRSLADGALPPALEAKILASTSPKLASARRVFGGTSAPPAPAATPEKPKSGDAPAVPLRPPGEIPTANVAATPTKEAASPAAPSIPSSAAEDAPTTPGTTAPSIAPSSAAPTAPAVVGDDTTMVMLTSLGLTKARGSVQLNVRSSGRPTVSIASQATRGRVTFMFASAGALPSVRQARPSLEGVRVVDVRRGETTVQVTVELQEGWRARRPLSTDGGVQVRFQRDAAAAP